MEKKEKNHFSISNGMSYKNLIYLIIILVIIGAGAGLYVYFDLKKDASEIDSNDGEITIDKSLIPNLDKEIVITVPMDEARKEKNITDIEEVKTQLKEDYKNFQNWIQLGLLYKAIGDYDSARDSWEFASILRPQNSVSFHNLGDLYHLNLKNYAKSEENYLKALENNPTQIFTYQNFHELYRYSYTEKSDQADKVLLDGLSYNPDNGYLAVLLAGYYESVGSIDGAIFYYKKALESDPLNIQIRENIEKLKEVL